jgi:Fe-S-cluster-containing hydrogenase component 2
MIGAPSLERGANISEEDKMSKQLMVKPDKCTGCRTCELICSWNRTKNFSPQKSAVSVVLNDDAAVFVPVMCLQCAEAHCINACSSNALSRNNNDVVIYDKEKCAGCGHCMDACPLKSIKFNSAENTIIKCELCGGDPGCVKVCPAGCLSYGEADASARKQTFELVVKAVKEASR